MNWRHRPLQAAVAASVAAAALLWAQSAAAAPDLTGVWQFRYQAWPEGAPPEKPQLTPAAQALVAKRRAARAAGYVRHIGNMLCLPSGTPLVMRWRSPLEILSGAGRLTILTEHEVFDEPRTIYLNEPKQPDDIDPTWNGHSVGRWSGDVLEVDTRGFNDRGNLFADAPRSPATHITERMHLEKGGAVLVDDMTITDPTVLTAPWTVRLTYDRMADTEERIEVVCEMDQDALKALDLNAIKDVDDEAARLLDPKRRYGDPAQVYAGSGK